MSGSTEAEASLKTLLTSINALLREYFDVRRRRAVLKLAHEKKQAALVASFAQQDEPLNKRESELGSQLRELLVPNRAALLTGARKSFSTKFGNVYFHNKGLTSKVVNIAAFEQQARRDGTLRLFGTFTRTWKPLKAKDILALLAGNEPLKKKYIRFIETDCGHEELSVQPNEHYFTEYDPNRLTAPRVKLGTVDDVQDESPGA